MIGGGRVSRAAAARWRIYERREADDQPVVCHVTPTALIEQEAGGESMEIKSHLLKSAAPPLVGY